LETANVDGWLWRYASGGSLRANSVAALAFTGNDPDSAAVAVDMEGRMFRIDLAAAHQAMARSESPDHVWQDATPSRSIAP